MPIQTNPVQPTPIAARKKSHSERMIVVLSILSFTLLMVLIFIDAVGALHISFWAFYTFLGLMAIVVYGLLLVLHASDRKLGLRYNFLMMVFVVVGGASLTATGLARLGNISELAPVLMLLATLILVIMLKRSMGQKKINT